MSRDLRNIGWLAALLALTAGCNWDWDLDFSSPGLDYVPKRFALGASVEVGIDAEDPDVRVWAEDRGVISVARVDEFRVELTAVDVGETTIVVLEEGKTKSYEVEVAAHERHEVVLVQRAWGLVPEVAIDRRTLLSGVQHRMLVTLYDSKGLLFGRGVARLDPPAESEACELDTGQAFDGLCLILKPGLQVLELDVAGRRETLLFAAVPETDIVDLLLQRDKEEASAEPGDVIRVDALGVTSEGTLVHGLPTVRAPGDVGFPTPFTYELDPDARPQPITVTALGFERELEVRGTLGFPKALRHECWTPTLFGCF